MKILIIGGGGREHALAWKMAQSDKVETVFVAPGNAGTHADYKLKNIDIDVMDFDALANFVEQESINLSVVGPEAPLVEGIVDFFKARKLQCFGPSRAAAQLEGSKTFTKDFLARHNIPTAAYKSFTDPDEAIAYLNTQSMPIVIKADGLAAGKGVVIAETFDDASDTIKDMLSGNAFGEAGSRVVIEEFLKGEEASFIVVADGDTVLPMATSQDHKRAFDGDKGPNTGGMGAYSPAPVVSDSVNEKIMSQVIKPTIEGMKKEGASYTGFLYAGLMIDESGQPKVIEYNCRFGDPETQPIMMRLQSDLHEICEAACEGRLAGLTTQWDARPSVGVVLAAGGYPNAYDKGDVISGLGDLEASGDVKVFHAGTGLNDAGQVVTNGGRVLCVTAIDKDIIRAQRRAYEAADKIAWKGVSRRNDIAYRAIAREE